MYKQAIFMGITFPTNKGILSISQLPGLNLTDLAMSLKALKKALKKNEDSDLDFLDDTKTVDKTLELQFEILKDVYLTKRDERNQLQKEQEVKEHNNKIINLIAEKEDESLKGKSIDELKSLLK